MAEFDFNSTKINNGNEMLPIGTVVLVELVHQAVMIYGRKQQQEGQNKIWDYVGCPYPQGHLSEDTNVFFNHSQIKEVVYKGLETEGELALREKLIDMFSENTK
ncbi:DUF4176 domain-containing protein [Peribacillus sp. NPDC096447]|uniref:DUF4176 domain-containing protein n=1 Tax=Peribacillus sp. NPDC096447 TaxID=3364394 RepID=UPI00381AE398